jgi:hypothetical protein
MIMGVPLRIRGNLGQSGVRVRVLARGKLIWGRVMKPQQKNGNVEHGGC